MKRRLLSIPYIIFATLLLCPTLQASDNGNKGNINNNANSITNQITVNTSVTTEIANAVMIAIQENAEKIKREIIRVCTSTYQFFKTALYNHKWKLTIAGALGGYSSLIAANLYMEKELELPQRWFYWKHHLTLEELFLIPQEELELKLIAEIQRRYTNPTVPTDFITPFVLFMKDIEYEQKLLTSYKKIGVILDKIYLTNYTWYDMNLNEKCDQWLQRNAFVKSIFLNWMAHYKIKQHVKECIRASRFFLTPWKTALRLNVYL